MLLLSFNIGAQQFAIAAKQIIEILPLTSFKPISGAPSYVAGLLDYRGTPVPIINLCLLTYGNNYNRVLSSRIIIVNYTANNRRIYPLGLIAEKVTETKTIPKSEFVTTGICVDELPFLGDVTNNDGEMIQFVEINQLLTNELQLMLFNDEKTDSN